MGEIGKLGGTNGHSVHPVAMDEDTGREVSLAAVLEASEAPHLWCDRAMTIRWMNRAASRAVDESKGELSARELVGEPLDALFAVPAASRRALRASVTSAELAVEMLGRKRKVTIIGVGTGRVDGYVVQWTPGTVVDATATGEAQRLAQMIETAPVNIMYCDRDLTIRYANASSIATLSSLQQYLSVPVEKLVGSSIDAFHENPAHQRRLLADPTNLPIRADITLGPESLSFLVTAMRDMSGEYVGPMLTWEVITEQVATRARQAELRERERARAEELLQKVNLILEVVNAAAAGDLTKAVSVTGGDAIGQMGDGLGKFFRELRASVSGIAGNAGALKISSEELARVSETMSASAEETSAQAGVVSAASEQVSRNIQTVATAADQMGASIREIAKNATDAARVATQAVKVAETTNTTVSKLGESSGEIGKVIKVITSIAQQTNLLALNATIEAARAGEAGKGFAVVANEVKELAKETAKATEDISQKIEAIQRDTRGAVAAIGQIGAIINQINDIQSTIASAVEEQTATTNEISRNVAEAAKGSSEITQNIAGVAKAAHETSAGATETQSAATSLSEMAATLQKLVARFRY